MPVSQENLARKRREPEGDLAFARRDFYAALIKYLEASRLNPNSQYISNKLGIAYSQLKYYTEATGAFQRAIALDRKFAFAYNNLGTVYFALDDKKSAERYFRKAVSLQDNVASFHINLGTLLLRRANSRRAWRSCARGWSSIPGFSGRAERKPAGLSSRSNTTERSYFMARVYASMGDVDRAVDNLQQALNSGFTDIDAIRREPDFDKIRQETRFVAFMQQATLITKNWALPGSREQHRRAICAAGSYLIRAPARSRELHQPGGKQGDQNLVVARDRDAASACLDGPPDHVFGGPVVLDEIEVGGREILERGPVFRTSVTHFRKTSGSVTAEPQFR